MKSQGPFQLFYLLLASLGCTAIALGADTAGSGPPPRPATGLQWPDLAILAGYMAIVLGMGWYYSGGQTDSRDYFIAARRHIHPTLIGISMFATLLSTISYLGKPGEMVNKGPYLLIGQILSIPLAYVIVGYWVIPGIMRQRVTSAYELLEQRLGLAVRLLGSALFVGLRLVWMGLLIYMASVAIVVILGVEPKWTPLVSAISGFVAVIYTSLGGLRTVVVTDVFQFGLLLCGALLTIGLITGDLGGFSWVPTEWSPHWDRQAWFSLDPFVRVTVFTSLLSTLVWRVATAGGDQTAVQRYMATEDTAAARRSYLITELATLVVTVVLALLGLALLGFFSRFPEALGPGMTLAKDADRLFPYFISNYLPVGVTGLLLAAVVAAAMSSIDSGVNSITAVVMRDYLQRFGWHPQSAAGEVQFSRWMAFAIGGTVVTASLFMQHVPGNFVEMTNKTANLVVSPLFALFVLALWVPFATPLGALAGCAYGLSTAFLMGFWDVLTGQPALSFQWMGPTALAVNLLVGVAVSRWGPRRENLRTTRTAGATLLLALAAGIALLLGRAAIGQS